MKNTLKTLIPTIIFIFVIAGVSAQNELLVQLVNYDASTQQSKIHIQNNAGFELNELDFYINSIKTGRITGNLADGKAVVYFQTITPGTYDVTIKTKEGIEFTKEIEFEDVTQTVESEAQETKPKTASQIAQDPEYLEFLEEQKKEQEIRRQRESQQIEEPEQAAEVTEEKEKLSEEIIAKQAEKPIYSPVLIIISILIFIFILIYFFKRKNRI
ncbi:MAG: hypothetical protein QF535_00275 [Anaerolineales bacterium]|jgi:hypothetical protein|nr:hypothetical protein [Anaerolineales bacterium]|tara:strand:- start:727 stop:1368 length:642 start_codon:yes stop_codon:yes gene_type:complete